MSPPIPEARAKRRRLAGFTTMLLAAPQRRPVLALIAAVAGVALAAAGVFHPAPRDLTAVPPGDVALVNQQPILMSDFIDETQTATGGDFADATPAQRAKVLHDMIDQELIVQRSLALNLPEEDTGVRDALVEGVNNEISSGVLATTPDEASVRAYFAAHRADYASKGVMNLTDLVLHVGGFENVDQSVGQALADAAQAVYELRSGAAMDYVQQHFSMMDSGKVSGDTLDFAAQIHLGPKLYAAAQGLSDGQVSDPIADADGVHVLVMHHRVAPVQADFDSVRNNVYYDYVKQQQTKARQEHLNYLRSTAQILLAPGQGE
jgi:hypothetical protein